MGINLTNSDPAKRTKAAARLGFPAELLSRSNDKGMEFVEKGGISRQSVGEKGLHGGIIGVLLDDAMPEQYTVRVSVNYENRPVGGVQQDAVRGLRSNTPHGQQIFPKNVGLVKQHSVEFSRILPDDHLQEILQAKGFDIKIAGRPDQFGKDLQRDGRKAGKGEKSCCLQIGNSLFNIGPTGVLGEDGTNSDLERTVARPPVLRAEAGQQLVVDFYQRCGQRRTIMVERSRKWPEIAALAHGR